MGERADGGLLRYGCRVGHAFAADSLVAEQSEALEAALCRTLRLHGTTLGAEDLSAREGTLDS